jgi:hypothetical protein
MTSQVFLIKMKTSLHVYQSYLLRLWKEGLAPGSVWRASLQNVATGECTNFANLNELFRFLLVQSEISGAEIHHLNEEHDAGYP